MSIVRYVNKKTGVVASVLVQNGTLRLGDPIVVGESFGKIRSPSQMMIGKPQKLR